METAGTYDVAVVGGGIAGMATAARLQARGFSTVVLESHGQPGGCCGFFRRREFSFDVGATTLVDFEQGGVGGQLFGEIGMPVPPLEVLPGYMAWLPDRTVTLHRDSERWSRERLQRLGDSPGHRRFWLFMDGVADVFWQATRRGARLPIRSLRDAWHALQSISPTDLPLMRYLNRTMGDALRRFGLDQDRRLVSLLSMMVEDTVHSTIDAAPLINASLGVSIRGAGLTRCRGGMRGFWMRFLQHYRALGGDFRGGNPVRRIDSGRNSYRVVARRGVIRASQVVSAVPVQLTAQIGPPPIADLLKPWLERDHDRVGGAIVVFLGVPEHEVAGHSMTHHQLMHSYDAPLGDGNNMFVSVSSPHDTDSAPSGHRAVMISTHCDLSEWKSLAPAEYAARKERAGRRLLELARRAYPELGRDRVVFEVATPRTFERFTGRPDGATGGFRLSLRNSNQHAIPSDVGMRGFHLAGDTTWPGLGTVACVLGSRIVADQVERSATRGRVRVRRADRCVRAGGQCPAMQ